MRKSVVDEGSISSSSSSNNSTLRSIGKLSHELDEKKPTKRGRKRQIEQNNIVPLQIKVKKQEVDEEKKCQAAGYFQQNDCNSFVTALR